MLNKILPDWQNLNAAVFLSPQLLSWVDVNSLGRCLVTGFIDAKSHTPSVAFSMCTFTPTAVFKVLDSLPACRSIVCGSFFFFLAICNYLMTSHEIFIFAGLFHRWIGPQAPVNEKE